MLNCNVDLNGICLYYNMSAECGTKAQDDAGLQVINIRLVINKPKQCVRCQQIKYVLLT